MLRFLCAIFWFLRRWAKLEGINSIFWIFTLPNQCHYWLRKGKAVHLLCDVRHFPKDNASRSLATKTPSALVVSQAIALPVHACAVSSMSIYPKWACFHGDSCWTPAACPTLPIRIQALQRETYIWSIIYQNFPSGVALVPYRCLHYCCGERCRLPA